MDSPSRTDGTATSDMPQGPTPNTSQDNENEQHDAGLDKGDDRDSVSPTITMASLQRDLHALRSKIARMEKKDELEVNSDTDDEIPEFDKRVKDVGNSEVPDLPTQDRIWENWMTRRKVAKDIIRKSNRLRKLNKQGKLRDVHMKDSDFDDEEVKVEPKDPNDGASEIVPILNPCAWNEFNGSTTSKYAIDVLIGKPAVVWRRGFRSIGQDERISDSSLVKFDATTATSTSVGLLPDRLRVNSRLLLLVFAHLHRTNLFTMFRNEESVVFLRPFKMLVYFQQELRDQYKKLISMHTKENITNTDEAISADPGSGAKASKAGADSIVATTNDADGKPNEPMQDVEDIALRSELMLQHMHPLMQFVDSYIVPRQKHLESELCNKITFHDMWLVFKPGEEVIESDGNQVYRVVEIHTTRHRAIPPWEGFEKHSSPSAEETAKTEKTSPKDPWIHEGDNKPFKLRCVYIDSDGLNLGPVTREIEIDSFQGEKSIFDLPVYPLRLRKDSLYSNEDPDIDALALPIRDQLIARGKRFLRMSAIEHAYYSGPIHGTRDILEGQVVVDNSLVFQSDKSMTPPVLSPWVRASDNISAFDMSSLICSATCCRDHVVWSDQSFDGKRNSEYLEIAFPSHRTGVPSLAALERQIQAVQKSQELGEITDAEYIVMSDRVYGFILRDRKWAELDLRFLSEVSYGREEPVSTSKPGDANITNTAFDDLVLPPGHKEVILSLVAQHFRGDEHREVDIIRGKGKGLILLLHGAPGVGKTSTAEGVAEAFKKPLLQITSGDLGLTANTVGENLQRNFDLASRWDCVLLLDEADVFLASRSSAESNADLNRNALVAVFLRVLEYYTGILFLTTNRIGDFDEAFASRIHLSLEYPQLNKASTESILALNIEMIKKRFKKSNRTIDIEEIKICSKFISFWEDNEGARLNGRQIRNACQTALALAEFEAQGNNHKAIITPDATVRLRPSHFDTILDAYLDFAVYLNKTYGISPEERAKEQKLRARDRTARKAKASHVHTGSAGSHTGGFGGAHLYNQPVQQFASGQHGFQGPVYAMPSQGQQFFQGQMSGQQAFQNPMQYSGQSASLPGLPGPALRNEQYQLPVPNLQQPSNQMEDTQAGHSAHFQVQPVTPGSASQYPQPQQPDMRY